MNTCACFTPNTAREVRLRQFITDWKIDGVIYHVSQACHTYGMEQRRINREMEKMDIPVLNIETDFSQEDVEQIRTRIEAFLELITSKKRRRGAKATVGPAPQTPKLPDLGTEQGTREKLPPPQTFKFKEDFPVYEQPLGDEYVPKNGKQWKMEDLKPPGG
jgi:hypothetical protein